MKSTTMPSILVKQESGNDCQFYEQKDHFKNRGKKGKLDNLNDPKLW
ncbi:hypothetical protein [Halobacteriovorax sp. DPLXC-1]